MPYAKYIFSPNIERGTMPFSQNMGREAIFCIGQDLDIGLAGTGLKKIRFERGICPPERIGFK